MKRTTKKYLMLVLTLAVLMTAMVFAVSAEDCQHVTYEGSKIEPTCTDWGYTEVWCNKCHQMVGQTKLEKPSDHSWEWGYKAVNDTESGSYFVNEGNCTYGCGTTTVEKDAEGNTVVYYSVEFKNPMAAAAYDPQIKYVDVVSARVGIENAVSIATIYVKSGETADYDGKAYCEKDHKYGKYDFIGWIDKDGYTTIEPAPVGEDAAAINAANAEKKANIQSFLSENPITENTVLYAAFEADNGVTYNVYFHNGEEIAVATAVPHGTAVVYKGKLPTKDADVKNRYEFMYWSYGINEVNLDQIYGDADFMAYYKPIERQYNLTYYYDDACTQPVTALDGTPIKDGAVKYDGVAGNGLGITKEALESKKAAENDPRYIYAWTGEWELASRPGYIVDLNMVTVPHGTPDNTDGSAEVRLVPVFEKTSKIYPLNITLIYPDDNNYHPEEIGLQVLDASGLLVAGSTISKANQDGVDTYKCTYNVNYSSQYTIAATSVGYTGTAVSTFFNEPSGVIIIMEKVPPHSCGCICHTFLKPLWVGVLNFLNALFGIEHVCCNDMYANIGSELRYGPGK